MLIKESASTQGIMRVRALEQAPGVSEPSELEFRKITGNFRDFSEIWRFFLVAEEKH
jgi:hypothetical protein